MMIPWAWLMGAEAALPPTAPGYLTRWLPGGRLLSNFPNVTLTAAATRTALLLRYPEDSDG